MPKGENMQTVALNLDRDHYNNDVRPAAAAAGLSASEWIRRAIAEKLDGAPDDARLRSNLSLCQGNAKSDLDIPSST